MVIFQPRANLRLFRCIAKRLYSHVYKRQNPGFVFRGLLPIVLYRFRISHLSNENNVAFHGGWCIPFPLSFPLLPNIPGLSIYRKFRVKISTRSAYLFGASIIRGAFGRHIGNFRRTFIFHCVALLSVYSLPGICSGGSFSNRPVGFVFRN